MCIRDSISSVSIFICLIIVYNVLNHLPYIDFRAYKIGTNIIEARKDCSQLGLPCDKYSQIMKVKRLDNREIIEISEQEYVNNFQLYESICINTKTLVFDQVAFTKLYHELLVLQQSHILTNFCLSL